MTNKRWLDGETYTTPRWSRCIMLGESGRAVLCSWHRLPGPDGTRQSDPNFHLLTVASVGLDCPRVVTTQSTTSIPRAGCCTQVCQFNQLIPVLYATPSELESYFKSPVDYAIQKPQVSRRRNESSPDQQGWRLLGI